MAISKKKKEKFEETIGYLFNKDKVELNYQQFWAMRYQNYYHQYHYVYYLNAEYIDELFFLIALLFQ